MKANALLLTAVVASVLFVVGGAIATLTGVLASLPVHGTARYAVWALAGAAVAAVGGWCTHRWMDRTGEPRHPETSNTRKDGSK